MFFKLLLITVTFLSMNKAVPLDNDNDVQTVDTNVPHKERSSMGRKNVKGDTCQYIKLKHVKDQPGCEEGTKFVIGQEKGVRKQFLNLNGQTVVSFIKSKQKFAECPSFTEVTKDVTCKTVDGLKDVDLENNSNQARMLKGASCDFIKLEKIIELSGCYDGTKFITKQEKGVRKQYLIKNGQTVLAFIKSGEKFAECSTFTDVTSKVSCKNVEGLENVNLDNKASESGPENCECDDEGDTQARFRREVQAPHVNERLKREEKMYVVRMSQ